MRSTRRGVLLGLTAALSFGASAPIAKRLLDEVDPQMLAGLLYAGAFVALVAVPGRRRSAREARLRAADGPRLALLTLAGGIVAPVLLLVGLERVRGVTGSLLLNLEGPATVLLAVTVFGEHLSRRVAIGGVAVFAGAALLTLESGGGTVDAVGVACIVAACVGWAIDNNVTQALTVRDPVAVVRVKAGVAATANIVLAGARGDAFPGAWVLVAALALGAVSYGLSVVFDAYALRELGAAREAAVFATAPFAGAVLAVPVLSEHLRALDLAGAALMALGIVAALTEDHEHLHTHPSLTHDHVHVHDEHHRHEHATGTDAPEPHAHVHTHEPLAHAHPHVSDVHHRHRHGLFPWRRIRAPEGRSSPPG